VTKFLAYLFIIVAGPLIEAGALSRIWTWLKHDWPDISFGQWYGVVIIAHILIDARSALRVRRASGDRAHGKSESPTTDEMLLRCAGAWSGMWTLALIAWCVGSVFGWVLPP
jgi:hypothetical protein